MILSLPSAITVTFSYAGRCPCTVPPGTDSLSRATIIQRARSDAYAVLLGRVIRVDTLGWDSLFLANSRRPIVEPRLVRYRLDSVTSWKGPREDQIHVFVQQPYMTCGRTLELNQEYLLFTYRGPWPNGQGIEIDACSRVEVGSQRDSTVAVLGRPRHRPRNRRSLHR